MVIGIPTLSGKLSPHFGHCRTFSLVHVNAEREIAKTVEHETGEYERGMLPDWLYNMGVNVVIAGGIGERARTRMRSMGMDVVCGAPVAPVEEVALAYLSGDLQITDNFCDDPDFRAERKHRESTSHG